MEKEKKTTDDEGKTFSMDTEFICVQDCWQNNTRYRKGDILTGKKCPPWFITNTKANNADRKEEK